MEDERDSRKMPGRKMKTSRAFIAIFLPAIFLLSIVCIASNCHWNFAPSRRHALDAGDLSANDQQRVVEIVHRRANVARDQV
jgi:hypothetical protein